MVMESNKIFIFEKRGGSLYWLFYQFDNGKIVNPPITIPLFVAIGGLEVLS